MHDERGKTSFFTFCFTNFVLNIFLKVPSNIIPTQGLKLYNLLTLATCILKKNARRHKIDCQTRFVCHQIGLERQRCDERDFNAYSFFFNTLFFSSISHVSASFSTCAIYFICHLWKEVNSLFFYSCNNTISLGIRKAVYEVWDY